MIEQNNGDIEDLQSIKVTRNQKVEDNPRLLFHPPPFPLSPSRISPIQANRDELHTTDTIQAAVVAMLGKTNALQAALDAKVNVADQYSDEDATGVVNSMVVSSGNTNNLLRTRFDTIDTRLEALEAVVGFS